MMMTKALREKIIPITEDSKFFDFMEDMVAKNKRTGILKLKDDTKHTFCYITNEVIDGKKVHYIHIC